MVTNLLNRMSLLILLLTTKNDKIKLLVITPTMALALNNIV